MRSPHITILQCTMRTRMFRSEWRWAVCSHLPAELALHEAAPLCFGTCRKRHLPNFFLRHLAPGMSLQAWPSQQRATAAQGWQRLLCEVVGAQDRGCNSLHLKRIRSLSARLQGIVLVRAVWDITDTACTRLTRKVNDIEVRSAR